MRIVNLRIVNLRIVNPTGELVARRIFFFFLQIEQTLLHPPLAARARTRKRGFKLPWREAGPPNHHDDKVDSDQNIVNKELSLTRARVVALC